MDRSSSLKAVTFLLTVALFLGPVAAVCGTCCPEPATRTELIAPAGCCGDCEPKVERSPDPGFPDVEEQRRALGFSRRSVDSRGPSALRPGDLTVRRIHHGSSLPASRRTLPAAALAPLLSVETIRTG